MFGCLLWICSPLFADSTSTRQTIDSNPLDQIERLSTELKERSQQLSSQLDIAPSETLPMLEIESSMIELENLVMQLEQHIDMLPSPTPSP